MAARIILTCWGSYGDFFPYLAIAKGLAARGEAPLLATLPAYRELIEEQGLAFRPLGPDVDPDDHALIERLMDPAKGTEVILRELIVPFLRENFDGLRAVAHEADLLVSHPLTFATRLVAEVDHIPWISTVLAPASMFSVHDFPVFPPFHSIMRLARGATWAARLFLRLADRSTASWVADVHALRTELGLPPAGHPLFAGQYSPFGTLALFSRVLGAPRPDWPPHTTLTGFPFYDGTDPVPPDLVRFLDGGDPPVVFTLGTSAVGAAGAFYAESLEAITRIGCRAVLLTGRDPRNLPVRALPASVIALEYAPHAELFSRAAAIVHHGGVGTTGQALRSGRPMLVVPHAHDQYDNARRVQALGLARVVDARRYRASRVAGHVRALLADGRYRNRARKTAAVVSAERGVDLACDVLQDAAGRGAHPRI